MCAPERGFFGKLPGTPRSWDMESPQQASPSCSSEVLPVPGLGLPVAAWPLPASLLAWLGSG